MKEVRNLATTVSFATFLLPLEMRQKYLATTAKILEKMDVVKRS